LVDAQYLPDGQEQQCVLLFQSPPRRSNQIDLRGDLGLLGPFHIQQRLQAEFLFLKVRAQIDEPEAILEERLLDPAHLRLRQAELPHDVRILPPNPGTRTHHPGRRRWPKGRGPSGTSRLRSSRHGRRGAAVALRENIGGPRGRAADIERQGESLPGGEVRQDEHDGREYGSEDPHG